MALGSKAKACDEDRHMTGTRPRPNASQARNDAQPDKGMVLLIVLWWLVLLAFSCHPASRDDAHGGDDREQPTRQRICGGCGRWRGEQGDFPTPCPSLASGWHVTLRNGNAGCSRGSDRGRGERIDPNVAPRALMQALLGACGAPPETAIELAAAIGDWRSPDISDQPAPKRQRSTGSRNTTICRQAHDLSALTNSGSSWA